MKVKVKDWLQMSSKDRLHALAEAMLNNMYRIKHKVGTEE